MTIGAGALNQNLLDSLRNGRWMLPIGTCPSVGVTGLVLGGGYGDNSRWGGLTCDHLVETDIVLASGETVTAGPKDNTDLFWGLRGAGGGNFGVNTSLTFQLIEVPRPTITVFGLRYTGRDDIVAAWSPRRFMLTAPDELTGFTGSATSAAGRGCARVTRPSAALPRPDDRRLLPGPPTRRASCCSRCCGPPRPKTRYSASSTAERPVGMAGGPRDATAWLGRSRPFTDRATPPDVWTNFTRVLAAPGNGGANAEVRMMCWSGGAVNRRSSDATAPPSVRTPCVSRDLVARAAESMINDPRTGNETPPTCPDTPSRVPSELAVRPINTGKPPTTATTQFACARSAAVHPTTCSGTTRASLCPDPTSSSPASCSSCSAVPG
jgi:hypothetical protein